MTSYLELSNHLKLISQLKKLEGGNPFSAGAYEKVADTIRVFDGPEEALHCLPGVGIKISRVINEFLEFGSSETLEALKESWPAEAMTMCQVDSIGPKTAYKLYQEGFHNLTELYQAAENGTLNDAKLAPKVKQAFQKQSGRHPYAQVFSLAEYLKDRMAKASGVLKVEIGGSLRRKLETIKDIDLMACVENDATRASVMDSFKILGPSSFVGQEIKSSISFPLNGQDSIHVDLWLGKEGYWGSLLNHVTGSRNHNIHLRSLAKARGWTVNEYGCFDEGGNQLGGKDEGDLYRLLDLDYVEPEHRS